MQLELTGRHRALAWPRPRLAVSSRVIGVVASCATGVVAFGVYLTTLAPTVMWYDMGEFVTASETLGIAHNTGYPLLILLGKLFTFIPAGDVAWRVNLMSALFTAVAVALVFGIIHDLTSDVIASAAGALTLAFASTVWANATWATSYGLNLFFTALILRLMFSWHRDRQPAALVAAALAFGLALGNHRLIVLVAPPAVLLLALGWRDVGRATAVRAALAFCTGLAVYAYLPIRGEQDPALSWARPAEWRTYVSMMLNGQTPSEYWRFSDALARIDVLRSYPVYDLTWAGIAMAVCGLAVCVVHHRAVAVCALLLLTANAFIAVTYSIHNVYNYLTPAYLVLAILIGVGCSWVLGIVRASPALDGRSRHATSIAACALALLFLALPASLLAQNAGRVDRSGDYAAYDFARTTLDRLPPRAVVLTDSWTAPPLWYIQLVEGDRRDVFVTPIFSSPGEDPVAFARAQIDAGRPVYAAEGLRAPIGALADAFTLEPVAVDAIESMVVDTLPRPAYRDDLIPKGTLYRVVDTPPDIMVDAVPAGSERNVTFDAGVTLVGFKSEGNLVDRGSVVRLTYYWRADRALAAVPEALTLFADGRGHIASRHGWPIWQQSRGIAHPLIAARDWQPGPTVRESHYVLVPRGIAPGTYDVRLTAYDSTDAPEQARDTAAAGLVTVGRITVR